MLPTQAEFIKREEKERNKEYEGEGKNCQEIKTAKLTHNQGNVSEILECWR